MARTKCNCCGRSRLLIQKRNYGVWLQKWNKISAPIQKDCDLLLMKTIKNYPKTLCALHPVTKNIGEMSNPFLKRLVKKYKKDFFRNVTLYKAANRGIPLEFLGSRITSLCVDDCYRHAYRTDLMFKKHISNNKHLKIYEQDPGFVVNQSTVKYLKYLNNLSSVCLSHLQYLEKQAYKRILFASSSTLETVTLKGKLDAPYISKTSNIIQLLEIVFQLPRLKRFNFDATVSTRFDIDKIPFYILQSRNISYDIRASHKFKKFTFSKANLAALSNVELLGINLRERWAQRIDTWDCIQETSTDIQKSSQKSLFLNMNEMKSVVFTNLFKTCKNISTLDLKLNGEKEQKGYDFSGLKYLENVRNLLIQFSQFSEFNESLLKNLSSLIRNNQSLSLLSLDFFKSTITEINPFPLSFLDLCQDKIQLNKIILKLDQVNIPDIIISGICEGLNSLEQVKSFTFISTIEKFPSQSFFKLLAKNNSLEELTLQIKSDLLHFNPPGNLRKLSLNLGESDVSVDFLKKIGNIPHLKHLELRSTEIDKTHWIALRKQLRSLPVLETVKIGFVTQLYMEDIKNDLHCIITNHQSLKLIVVEIEDNQIDYDVYVVKHKHYPLHIDSYLWYGQNGIPRSKKLGIHNF